MDIKSNIHDTRPNNSRSSVTQPFYPLNESTSNAGTEYVTYNNILDEIFTRDSENIYHINPEYITQMIAKFEEKKRIFDQRIENTPDFNGDDHTRYKTCYHQAVNASSAHLKALSKCVYFLEEKLNPQNLPTIQVVVNTLLENMMTWSINGLDSEKEYYEQIMALIQQQNHDNRLPQDLLDTSIKKIVDRFISMANIYKNQVALYGCLIKRLKHEFMNSDVMPPQVLHQVSEGILQPHNLIPRSEWLTEKKIEYYFILKHMGLTKKTVHSKREYISSKYLAKRFRVIQKKPLKLPKGVCALMIEEYIKLAYLQQIDKLLQPYQTYHKLLELNNRVLNIVNNSTGILWDLGPDIHEAHTRVFTKYHEIMLCAKHCESTNTWWLTQSTANQYIEALTQSVELLMIYQECNHWLQDIYNNLNCQSIQEFSNILLTPKVLSLYIKDLPDGSVKNIITTILHMQDHRKTELSQKLDELSQTLDELSQKHKDLSRELDELLLKQADLSLKQEDLSLEFIKLVREQKEISNAFTELFQQKKDLSHKLHELELLYISPDQRITLQEIQNAIIRKGDSIKTLST